MRLAPEDMQPRRASGGPIKRWVVGKPRLAATSSGGYTDPGQKSQLEFTYYAGVVFRASVVIGALLSFVGIASWIILIGTVLATPKIENERFIVQRAAWPESQAPANALALMLNEPVDRSIAGRYKLNIEGAGSPAIIRILAGPGAKVRTDENLRIIINESGTNAISLSPIANHNIGNNYIATCLRGPCGLPGTPLEVPVNQVLGKVLGTPSLTGIKPVSTAGIPGGDSA